MASSSAGNGFSTNGNANNDPLDSCERLGEATHEKGSVRDSLRKVSIGDRIGCYTWTWFTSVSGTIPAVLSVPYVRFC